MSQKKIEIRSPNTHFNGIREGVQFKDGVAYVSKKQADELVSNYGYSLEPFNEESQEDAPAEQASQLAANLKKRFNLPDEAGDDDIMDRVATLDTDAGLGSIFIQDVNKSLGLPANAPIKEAIGAIDLLKKSSG